MAQKLTSIALIVTAMATLSCKGGGTDPDPAVCRTYLTAFTRALSGGTTNVTCSFNQTTNQMTCVSTQGGAPCDTQVQTYASKADFVDEVRVIPPAFLLTSDAYTNQGACGTPTRTSQYSYDGQRRVTRIQDQASGFANTYTAWDASGRPTAAGNPGPPAVTYTWTYNDSTRTQVQTTTTTGAPITATTVFDANGNYSSITTVSGAQTFVTTYTPSGTAQVCK